MKKADPMERLGSVKGHLVSFPLDFMLKEDLRPVFKESEYYASPQVFHWTQFWSNSFKLIFGGHQFRILVFAHIFMKGKYTSNEFVD